jgi:hypothetical protein
MEIHADYLDDEGFEVEKSMFDSRFFSKNHTLDRLLRPTAKQFLPYLNSNHEFFLSQELWLHNRNSVRESLII